MKIMKNVFLHIGVWLAVLVLLFGLLASAAAIPNSAIKSNMEKSALSYADKEAFSFENGKKFNAIADNYADSILLGVAWNMGNGTPLSSAIDTKYYDGEKFGESYGLYLSVTEGAEANTEYTRYWHGTAAFVRLFHLFTDVDGVKTIGFAAVIAAALAVMLVLALKKHADIALIFGISLCAVQVWNVRLSMEYQPAFLVALLLCIACLALEKRGEAPLTLVFVSGGALVCFFDFLTAETLSLLLPLTLVVAVRAREKRLGTMKEALLLAFKCICAWGFAYAGTFLAKWTAATLVTGENAFAAALSSAGERLGGSVSGAGTQPKSIFSPLVSNIGVMFGAEGRLDYMAAFLPLAIIMLVLFSAWYLFRREEGEKTAAKLLLMLGALVLLRLLILNNHSYMHSFFTYRALAPAVFASLAALLLNAGFKKGKRGKK